MTFDNSTFVLMTLIWALCAVPVLIIGVLGIDFSGRLGGETKGPRIPSRWGWFIMEIPALTVFPVYYLTQSERHPVGDLLLVLWVAHYAHRTLIWPWFVQRKSAPFPVITCATGFGFNIVNGLLLGWFLTNIADYPDDWFADSRFIVGTALFLLGAVLNITSDYRLARMRNRAGGRYVIPRGGPFNFLSSPNLTGEMIEWIGFAFMSWSLPGLAFALWTVANLAPRALWRHRWYRDTFDDYPENRGALLPGLFQISTL